MADFDRLAHEQQLGVLLELARSATGNYDLPDGSAVEMINLSENATYRVDAPDGRRWALPTTAGCSDACQPSSKQKDV